MATSSTSLKAALGAVLSEPFTCNLRYILTPPKPCDPLFSPPPGLEPEKTRLAHHFLAVSAAAIQNLGKGNLVFKSEHADVTVFGIEVLVYTTKHSTIIFVSKADSTGFMPQNPEAISVKPIVTTFLQWLASEERCRKPGKTVVLSLFARAQSQYLFPGSAENGRKHILDDRQLIKWWAKVLDPIVSAPPNGNDGANETPGNQGYLTVPGFERTELRQFYPNHSSRAGAKQGWQAGHPLRELAEVRGVSSSAPPRCLLPRFPDDPKARYMAELDDEVGLSEDPTTTSPVKQRKGMWGSVRDLDRFWEAMEFRQECSSGRMVGFLWVVIPAEDAATNGSMNGESQDSSQGAVSSDQATPRDTTPTPSAHGSPKKKRRPLTGPIIPRRPRLKGGSSSLSATSAGLNGMVDSAQGNGGLMLTRDGYDQAMQTLLHLDFANLDVAARSTSKWVSEVSSICGLASDFAIEVTGTAGPVNSTQNANGSDQVNDLGGIVRKKRKVADGTASKDHAAAGTSLETADVPAVNLLGADMVRKKPKRLR
ncbi:hypothetical protein LTR36_004420 [Oleoguttula mirabilis]|uniref:histone acetyltransferase n=1 Tax=Oleoguttula mirabilis TaxID=1507867 RepID=A0AAV9JGD2_9PEZI|nr:hypothetical protein LTR36_004420 [Oleoguttula mirabilis]